MRKTISLFVLSLLLFASPVLAEHRIALLIDNSAHEQKELAVEGTDLSPLQSVLEKRGFRCRVVKGQNDDGLKNAIESFASATPTRGTALIYFRGRVLPGNYRRQEGLAMLGVSSQAGRGFTLAYAFDLLDGKGGSVNQIIVCDAPDEHEAGKAELPAGGLLAFASAETLLKALPGEGNIAATLKQHAKSCNSKIEAEILGAGSVAISPPDQLVPGKQAGDEWVNSLGMVFCWCPPGSFTMGSPEGVPGRFPDEAQREVEIKQGFWMAKYETTFGNWTGSDSRKAIGDRKNHPVNEVNQSKDIEARALRPLNEQGKKSLPSGWSYALPTEEQWEYAARAGTTSRYYFGDDEAELPRHANFADKSYYDTRDIYSNYAHRTLDDGAARLARVGSYQENPWGLCDMYGNVAEWCENRAVRGGSWASVAENCRSAYRDTYGDRDSRTFIGVRYVIRGN